MKIEAVEIYKSAIRLKEPFVLSLGSLTHAENVIVIIRTDTYITGIGECSPFMTINGESMETAFTVAGYLGKKLLGRNAEDINALLQLMDKVIYGNSSIKSAFDIALHDIAARAAGMPLYAWLGGKKSKEIVTDYTVSLGNKEKMAADALKIKDAGFQVIKVKLGGTMEEDVERIQAIREAVGKEIPVRIDANQGWKAENAPGILKALNPYNIQFCEEPIARWDYLHLPQLSAQSPIPVMADESCFDHHDAERLIRLSACKYFNIKLGKSGGIHNAMKIIRMAENAGIYMQVGGFLESRIGFTASAHIALTSNNILFYDFDTPLMFENDPVLGGISYGRNGVISVPEEPGLGAYVDETFLKKLPCEVVR